jgi:hypothetical protein
MIHRVRENLCSFSITPSLHHASEKGAMHINNITSVFANESDVWKSGFHSLLKLHPLKLSTFSLIKVLKFIIGAYLCDTNLITYYISNMHFEEVYVVITDLRHGQVTSLN